MRAVGTAVLVTLVLALGVDPAGAQSAITTCTLTGVYVLTASLAFQGPAQFLGQFTFTPPASCAAGAVGTVQLQLSVLFAGNPTPMPVGVTVPYTVDAAGILAIGPGIMQGLVGSVTATGIANSVVFAADPAITPTTVRFAGTAVRATLAPPPAGLNPELLGTLRWDQLPRGYGDFAVGTGPSGVAFDGANIWVANFSSANVTKLRASDGAPQPGSPFAVGTTPIGVAFDGASIWVANFSSANVTKLRASDGALQGTFPVGTAPQGVAFDGANIWVANGGSANVTKLRASDGANLGTVPVGNSPQLIAFDGTHIWVTNFSSNTISER